MQITSEIWQVGGAGYTSSDDAAVYLLHVNGRAAIVDAGCGRHLDRLAANIRDCGIDHGLVDMVLLTHCHFDHTGGAAQLRDQFGGRVVAHELDAVALEAGNSILTAANWYGATMRPLTIDVKLTGRRSQIHLGGRRVDAFHIPGHTPGSVAYMVDSDDQRILFGQDVHGPLHDDFASDAVAYRQSLKAMADLGADILCEGHYGVFQGQAAVQDFIRSFL